MEGFYPVRSFLYTSNHVLRFRQEREGTERWHLMENQLSPPTVTGETELIGNKERGGKPQDDTYDGSSRTGGEA